MNQAVSMVLNAAWADGKKKIIKEFEREGRDHSEMIFRPSVRIQYLGIFDDLEVKSPSDNLVPDDIWKLARSYDDLFEEVYRRGTKSPELGYHITKAVSEGIVLTPKPKLSEFKEGSKDPIEAASKGMRDIYWNNDWQEASLWEMEKLESGNMIEGPSVIEAPAMEVL